MASSSSASALAGCFAFPAPLFLLMRLAVEAVPGNASPPPTPQSSSICALNRFKVQNQNSNKLMHKFRRREPVARGRHRPRRPPKHRLRRPAANESPSARLSAPRSSRNRATSGPRRRLEERGGTLGLKQAPTHTPRAPRAPPNLRARAEDRRRSPAAARAGRRLRRRRPAASWSSALTATLACNTCGQARAIHRP